MIKSMTGFGRFEKLTERYKISVEIKSVNHRYCDMNIKMPKKFNMFENKIRNLMKAYINRGKVDIFINFTSYADGTVEVTYHSDVAKGYVEAICKAEKEFSLTPGVGLSGASLIRFPDVISLEEQSEDMEQYYPYLEEALKAAGQQFVNARETEGAHLQKDIFDKLDGIERLVDFVEERSPQILKEYREKIQAKVEEFLGDSKIDESILATELTIYADKVCVDEETVRLRSHIKNMRDTLNKEEAIGRKLDFIAQEMNREANTILSKANDQDISEKAIDLKTEIEKIREQIQNIE